MTRKIVWRAAIALAATFALASCESTSNPSGLNTGELILQILGLSSGTDAAVTVTGPGGFSQNVTASGALANLTPGTYTITASPVASSTARYDVAPASQNISVSSNQTSNATVTYSVVTGSLTITVSGLPNGANGALMVTGPGGFSQAVTSTTTLNMLAPGAYTIAASAVSSGGNSYTPTPASQGSTVTVGQTASAAVAYAVTTGSLSVTVNGVPGGAMGAVTVTGPGGFNQPVTATTTLTGLTAGSYTVAATAIASGGNSYGPTPASQNVAVTAGQTANATVTYAITTGSLTVTINGVPNGVNAAVMVTGPGGYSQSLTATTTLTGLTAGSYTVAATPISSGGNSYGPTPESQNAAVMAGQTAHATVTYAITTGSLTVTINGVPNGANAAVMVTGPGGYSQSVTATTTLTGLTAGSYTVAASAISSGGNNYGPTPASQNVAVTAGQTASATVTYAITTGSLTVTITGLPGGTNAAVTVTGPGGYNHQVTATATLTGLTPGSYTVAASNVTSGVQTFTPAPASQNIAVTASTTPAAATVAYSKVTGSITVTVAGLPSGVNSNITVTGPGAYSHSVTATTTLTGLNLGSYTIAASSVMSGGQSYAPTPASQQATLSLGTLTASATVTYHNTTSLSLTLQPLVSGLSQPVYLTSPPGDSRLFIVEQTGTIRIYKNGALNSTPFIDVSSIIGCCGETGLLSIAFHPNYAANGIFFIYIVNPSGSIEIRRGTVSANADVANTSTDLILTIAHPGNSNHYGGLLKFGPDGLLYAGVGDGGGTGDPPNNAQTKTILLGKLLRIDIDHPNGAIPYSVPASNPFGNEVWAYGLRNPWRWSFDHSTGLLYIADVGQSLYEEVDIQPYTTGGLNYGWHIMEGMHCYDPSTGCDMTGLTLPQFEYPHSDPTAPCAIIGGYVYRGSAIPEIAGTYFYTDLCAGWLRSFQYTTGSGITNQQTWPGVSISSPTSFGEDSQGELYLVADGGAVYKIVKQ